MAKVPFDAAEEIAAAEAEAINSISLIRKEAEWVIREFSYISQLRELLRQFVERAKVIISSKELIAAKKSVSRQIPKYLMRIGRSEAKAYAALNRMNSEAKRFFSGLPNSLSSHVTGNKGFLEMIQIYSNGLLLYTSRRNGRLAAAFNKDLAEIRHIGAQDFFKNFIPTLNEAVSECVQPLLASLGQLRSFLESKQPEIIEAVQNKKIAEIKARTFSINMDSISVRRGIPPGESVFILDTSFINRVFEEADIAKKDRLHIDFSPGKVIVPKMVDYELKHPSAATGAPLVGSKRRNYFFGKVMPMCTEEAVDRKKDRDTEEAVEIMKGIWKATPKGMNPNNEPGFMRGDMDVLVAAFHESQKRAVIVTQDRDFYDVVFRMKTLGKMLNVSVLSIFP